MSTEMNASGTDDDRGCGATHRAPGLGLLGLAALAVAGWGLAAFGVLPLATGAADICPICPLLGDDRRTRAQCKGSSCR